MDIPGSPIAYQIGSGLLSSFKKGKYLENLGIVRNGMKTGKNEEFVRLWFEVSTNNSCMDATDYICAIYGGKKWFPYNKGGEFRKWYGNNDSVVNWKDKGQKVIQEAKKDNRNVQDYPDKYKFQPIITWSLITTYKPSFRYKAHAISDICGMSIYELDEKMLQYVLALTNSCVSYEILELLNPTLNFQAGDIARIPVVIQNEEKVEKFAEENINTSKTEWDSFEESWDFKKHPLV